MNSKRKGKVGELELARVLRSYGYDVRRGQQYKGGADSPDVVGLPGVHVECKRVENLNLTKAYEQAVGDAGENIPVVMHRRSRQPWMITMSLQDFMEVYFHE